MSDTSEAMSRALRMGWRERRWSKEIDGQTRTCVADVNHEGFVQVDEQLIEQWMAEMGWTEVTE